VTKHNYFIVLNETISMNLSLPLTHAYVLYAVWDVLNGVVETLMVVYAPT
jgi:hypothetical protein